MSERVFLGIDIGSASVRAGLFDANGRRLAFAVRPIQQFHPKPLFVEQSSADIWAQTCAAVREAVATAAIDPARVVSIGVDATCSLVAVGPNGQPVSVAETGEAERDIIMWMDHRAAAETAAINATQDPALAYVGGEVSIEMELPKVLWIKQNHPDRYAATWRFFDLADYLVWRLADADIASVCTLTCKWNYLAHENRFSETLLSGVGLSDIVGKVPPHVLPLGSAAGKLSPRAAAELGLPPGVVVATGIIDAHAGGLALVGTEPLGSLAIIGGTSNCHMVVNPEPIMVPGTQQQLVNGNPNITQTVEVETWALNPDFDASLPYMPRADRPEWNLIGLLGQIPVRKGHPTHPSWRKLRPISAQADLWLVIR